MIDTMTREFGPGVGAGAGRIPVDVLDRGDEFVVRADLPGYDHEDVEVTLSDATRLRIEAEREADPAEGTFVRRERRQGRSGRTVTLPEAVDEDATGATYDAGVLEITLGKRSAGTEGTDIPVN